MFEQMRIAAIDRCDEETGQNKYTYYIRRSAVMTSVAKGYPKTTFDFLYVFFSCLHTAKRTLQLTELELCFWGHQ